MESTTASQQNIRYDSIVELTLVRDNRNITRLAEGYVDGLLSKGIASQNYAHAIDLLAYYRENRLDSEKLFSKIQEMAYYVTDMNSFISKVKHTTIDKKQADALIELATDISTADRILKNSRVLNEKMQFDNHIAKVHRNINVFKVVKEAQSMISKYNFAPYQEMNMVMEQLGFLGEKKNLGYTRNIYKSVFQYYTTHNSDKSDLIRVMQESSIVPDEVKKDINDRLERLGEVNRYSSITNLLSYVYLQDTNVLELPKYTYYTIKNASVLDICNNIVKIFDLIDNVSDIPGYIGNEMINAIVDGIKEKELDITSLNDIYNTLESLHGKTNEVYINRIISAIKDMRNMLYSVENIRAIATVTAEGNNASLDEYKPVKFKGGLIKVVHNLDKFLAEKEKELLDKLKKKAKPALTKAANVLFAEADTMVENIYSYIGADNKVDICVRQYLMTESEWRELDNTEDTIAFLDEAISKFNYSLDVSGLYNTRAYYTITEGVAEVHLKDNTILRLTDEQKQLVREAHDPSLDLYLDMINEVEALYEEYQDLPSIPLTKLVTYDNIRQCRLTEQSYLALMEALKYVGANKTLAENISAAYTDIMFEKSLYSNVRVDEKLVENVLGNWFEEQNVHPAVALEAYEIICTIINETSASELINEASSVTDHAKQNGYDWDDDEDEDNDSDDEDEDDDEEDKKKDDKQEVKKLTQKPSKLLGDGEDLPKGDEKKKTKFTLTGAILAAKGLAGKAKHYTGRVKEFINNLDHAITSYVTAMKKAASDERREQIIKGSVIPSFKKCLKFGVGLVLLGVATGGIVAPVIAALGGFALDKRLTEKEKLLILDEIDTELEVIDKELAMADQNNQLNKYRALLRYKKDLQRQYQRIRYNIRVGQDTAYFKSDVGMQKKD